MRSGKGTRSEASATAQAKDGALNQDYNSVVGLLTVCKRDVRERGVKNNKACVLKKRRLPSTEAGKTLGGAGGLRRRVGAEGEDSGVQFLVMLSLQYLSKWKRQAGSCLYKFEVRERRQSSR